MTALRQRSCRRSKRPSANQEAVGGARYQMVSFSSSRIFGASTSAWNGIARFTARSARSWSGHNAPYGPLGAWSKDERLRRTRLIQGFYREHAIEAAGEAGELVYARTSPPDWWVNERLEALGEAWRVHDIDGFRYEVYDFGQPSGVNRHKRKGFGRSPASASMRVRIQKGA